MKAPLNRWIISSLSVAALALAASCSKDQVQDPPDADGPRDAGGDQDATVCRFPPLSLCEPPGTRDICPDHWYCPGCNCTGPFKVAACSNMTQDCRWFCTGCYPDEYTACNDPGASIALLGRCGYCFHLDSGVELNPECDKLNAILDAQSPRPPADAGTAPADAGAPADPG